MSIVNTNVFETHYSKDNIVNCGGGDNIYIYIKFHHIENVSSKYYSVFEPYCSKGTTVNCTKL